MNFRDIRGHKYGRLAVVQRAPSTGPVALWVCRCDCGTIKVCAGSSLKGGKTVSCGCARKERFLRMVTKHGHARRSGHSKMYSTWEKIRQRCHNPRHNLYPSYGGRGVTMSAEWRDDFAAFCRDMGPKPSPQHTVGRIDNDGPYSRENCRWETPAEQNLNKRDTIWVMHEGERVRLHALTQRYGVPYDLALQRIQRDGWPVAKAVMQPPRSYHASR